MDDGHKKRRAIYMASAIFLGVLILKIFVVEGFVVKGDSMSPTLVSGDYVFINKLAYVFSGAERGDVVVAESRETHTRLVKRVMGLPGEWFDIDGKKFNVDPKEYFLLGDNKDVSIDSRALGGVDSWDVKGRVFGAISFGRGKYISF